MSTNLRSTDELVRLTRSPHAEVREWAVDAVRRFAPDRAEEVFAAFDAEDDDGVVEAVARLVDLAGSKADVAIPASLVEALEEVSPSTLTFAEARRRMRTSGGEAWALVRDFTSRDDLHVDVVAFDVVGRKAPRPLFDTLRAKVAAGDAAAIGAVALRRIADLAQPEDIASLIRWAVADDPDTEEHRWFAISPMLRAAGADERVDVEFEDEAALRAMLERDAAGSAVERFLTREVLADLRRVEGDRAAVRRDVATKVLAITRPLGGVARPFEAVALEILRGIAASETTAWTATNVLVETTFALGQLELFAGLLAENAPLVKLVEHAGRSFETLAPTVANEVLSRWKDASDEARAAAVDEIVRQLEAGDAEFYPFAAIRLASEAPGFPLERVLGPVFDDLHSDVADELATGVADHLHLHPSADPGCWSGSALEQVLTCLGDSDSVARAPFLHEHWETLVRGSSVDEVIDVAHAVGDARLLSKVLEEWRPGERWTAATARFLSRLDGAEAALPAAVIADAEACEEDHVPPGELVARLTCRRCCRAFWYDVQEAWTEKTGARLTFVAGVVIVCRRCGAVDEYRMSERDRNDLLSDPANDERTHDWLPELDDGTFITSASQAIRHARGQIEADPSLASWRSLAKVATTFRDHVTTVEALGHVLEFDPRDANAASSLALVSVSLGDPVATRAAGVRALALFVEHRRRIADAERADRARIVLVALMFPAVEKLPTAIRFTWKAGTGTGAGGIDLARVQGSRVVEVAALLASEGLVSATVVDAVTTEEVAALDAYLALRASIAHAVTPPSRNGPCPCGSGEKYKKCCGR